MLHRRPATPTASRRKASLVGKWRGAATVRNDNATVLVLLWLWDMILSMWCIFRFFLYHRLFVALLLLRLIEPAVSYHVHTLSTGDDHTGLLLVLLLVLLLPLVTWMRPGHDLYPGQHSVRFVGRAAQC